MGEIRPIERRDLPAVAALLHADLTPQLSMDETSRFLLDPLMDDPWRDEELPSLVAVGDNGEIIGFIGVQVRRFRLDERMLRGVCTSHLTVAAEQRGGATGALLLRRCLTAGQDFSFSDTASPDVTRMWKMFGGHLDHARAFDWMAVLRPIPWLRTLAVATLLRRQRREIPVRGLPLRRITPRGSGGPVAPDPDLNAEDVDAATIVDHLPELTGGFRLWVDYDEQVLHHLFGGMESEYGGVVRRLVRQGEQPLGWYAYVSRPGGVKRLLHLHAPARGADAVLDDLVAQARARGGVVLTGRSEPHLTQALHGRALVFGFARRPVIHSHDHEILSALATGSALRTQLDGEWFAI